VHRYAQLLNSNPAAPQGVPDRRPTRARDHRRARATEAALVAVLLAVAAAGCGSTSDSRKPDLALGAYLVQGNEEIGLQTTGPPVTSATAKQWTAAIPNGQAEESRLETEGFERAISVQTASAHGQGVSWVLELQSAADATREQAAELRRFMHVPGRVDRFTVPGVPTAEGFTYPGPDPQDANALFREGRCLLLVGDQEAAHDYRAPVVAAVRAIWARTNKNNGACTA